MILILRRHYLRRMQVVEANITVNNLWTVSWYPEHQAQTLDISLSWCSKEVLPSLAEPCCKINWQIFLFLLTGHLQSWQAQDALGRKVGSEWWYNQPTWLRKRVSGIFVLGKTNAHGHTLDCRLQIEFQLSLWKDKKICEDFGWFPWKQRLRCTWFTGGSQEKGGQGAGGRAERGHGLPWRWTSAWLHRGLWIRSSTSELVPPGGRGAEHFASLQVILRVVIQILSSDTTVLWQTGLQRSVQPGSVSRQHCSWEVGTLSA